MWIEVVLIIDGLDEPAPNQFNGRGDIGRGFLVKIQAVKIP
jgi:hypothetical protein